jgi:tetratricopeptide (TPR) repeat protein
MKKSGLLFLLFALGSFLSQAQIQTPAPSPGAKVEQRIGLVDVTVEYSRPSKKGRVIFGDLVPYDAVWRTGANAATKITFSDDVVFGGAEVKKGSYALMTKPGMKTWSVMLYPHTSANFGSYLESDVQPITVTTESYMMPEGVNVESFMMGFDNLTNSGGDLYMLWDKTYVPVSIKVSTDKAVEASIAKVMAGPSAGDYFSAAAYYLAEKKDLNKALEWINKSISMDNEKFWVLRQKSLIQAEMGDKAGAIATATRSLELAREAQSNDYIKMNEESIAMWKKK